MIRQSKLLSRSLRVASRGLVTRVAASSVVNGASSVRPASAVHAVPQFRRSGSVRFASELKFFLDNLFKKGIPTHLFARDGPTTTSHYSDHPPANTDGTGDLPFGILENLDTLLEKAGTLPRSSLFLTSIQDRRGKIKYANEAGIQQYVGRLFEDVVSALGYGAELEVRPEIALTKIKYLGKVGFNKADYWVVLTESGRPILVIEVKCPSTRNVLVNAKVEGQAVDYMADVMSFFGQYHVFGVTTTLEEFRIHWFPHSDQYAASITIPPVPDPLPPLDRGQVVLDRVLHHTGIIRHDDPDLPRILASVVEKSLKSPYAAVGLLDTSRAFIQLTRTSWTWVRLDPSLIGALTLEPDRSTSDSTSFIVVKYFFRSEEKKVWLSIAQSEKRERDDQRRMVIVKMVAGTVEAEREVDMWTRVNGCTTAFTTVLRDAPAFCTPFVIHASQDRATRRVVFDLDISHWIVQQGAVPQPLPPRLAAFQEQVQRLASGLDPRAIAREAVDRMAELGLQHDDLAWRHVALMPVFQDGDVVELQPALIDFGLVTTNVEPEQARQVMHTKLQEMEAECVWE